MPLVLRAMGLACASHAMAWPGLAHMSMGDGHAQRIGRVLAVRCAAHASASDWSSCAFRLPISAHIRRYLSIGIDSLG